MKQPIKQIYISPEIDVISLSAEFRICTGSGQGGSGEGLTPDTGNW